MKKRLLFLMTMTMIYSQVHSQECGTIATPQQINHMDKTKTQRENYTAHRESKVGLTMVPVQIHIVRRTNATGGLTAAQITTLIDDANINYTNSNIAFFQCQAVNYINNDSYFNFSATQENALASANDVLNVINIYFFNSVTSSTGSSLCGYSRFPPSADRIIMTNSCATNGSTMTHELGHFFSLYHTHGKTNTGTTDELVNGSNCSSKGDDICDTPADPNLSGLVNSSCVYTGSGSDANGDTYVPNPRNIMSYARKSCRTEMTVGQYNRVAFSVANDRTNLACSSTPSYCASNATNTIDTEIENVNFNTINQSSVNNCSGYTNYTAVSTNVTKGQTYALTITTGDCDGGSSYSRAFSAYIDWNGDADFTDAGELVLSQGNSTTTSANANVVVPSNAVTGITRMRIVCTEGGVNGPCGTYTYGETEDYSVNIGAATVSYCASNATSTIDTEIENVSFNTINQSSVNNCAGFSDYTGVSTNVAKGQTYTLSITTGDCDGGSSYSRGIAAYMDWNSDGDFTDSGEQLLIQGNGNTTTASANITVPTGAVSGSTRMRIVCTEGGVTGPCGTYTYGETEDYSVNIGSSQDVITDQNIIDHNIITVYPNPTNGNLNLEIQTKADQTVAYELIDLVGRAIRTNQTISNGNYSTTLDLSDLESGVYLLKVNINGESTIRKIVLEK